MGEVAVAVPEPVTVAVTEAMTTMTTAAAAGPGGRITFAGKGPSSAGGLVYKGVTR